MIQKTKDYFKFNKLNANRVQILPRHVQALKASILQRNMLDMRPIIVNSKFEVMDGNHRLEAAKQLGIDIYYTIDDKSTIQDLLLVNVVRRWTLDDYFNYYCEEKYPEYLKLKEFINKNDIKLGNAIAYCTQSNARTDFYQGRFKFESFGNVETIQRIKETINFVKRLKMGCNMSYTNTIKFWRPIKLLFSHNSFSFDKWMKNLELNISTFGPRGTTMQYVELFEKIYNYHNRERIKLNQDDLE